MDFEPSNQSDVIEVEELEPGNGNDNDKEPNPGEEFSLSVDVGGFGVGKAPAVSGLPNSADEEEVSHKPPSKPKPAAEQIASLEDPKLLEDIMNHERPDLQIERVTLLRKLLSIEIHPPVAEVIATGVVPYLIAFLTRYDQPILQFEACWALTNIASSSAEHTETVLGAIPILCGMLRDGKATEDVQEQAIWCLGNLAGDSPKLRDLVLMHGALPPLCKLLNTSPSPKLTTLRNGTWALSNFARGKPQPDFEIVSHSLPTLARLLYCVDEEVLTDTCWALSYLSDGANDRITRVIQAGVVPRLVELLKHKSVNVVTPALRTMGNIVTGDDHQTQVALNSGVLKCLKSLISHPKKGIRKEAIWAVSNITAGDRKQIQAVIDAALVPDLMLALQADDIEIKKEACWALCNMTSGGTAEQLEVLVRQGIILRIVDVLKSSDPRIQMVAMEGITNIVNLSKSFAIKAAGGKGPTPTQAILHAVQNSGGRAKLLELSKTMNDEVADKANAILDLFTSEGFPEMKLPEENDKNEGEDDSEESADDMEEISKKVSSLVFTKKSGKGKGKAKGKGKKATVPNPLSGGGAKPKAKAKAKAKPKAPSQEDDNDGNDPAPAEEE